MAEVGSNSLVPVLEGDVFPVVSVVAGGVVDEDGDRAECGLEVGERASELVDVAKVGFLEVDGGAGVREFCGESGAARLVEVDEADARVLVVEGADDLLADARGAAGDVDGGGIEAGIGGAGHRWLLVRVEDVASEDTTAER